jgi:hypothetical protein
MARTQNKLQQVEEILGEGVGRRSFQVSRSERLDSLIVSEFICGRDLGSTALIQQSF